MTPKIILLVVAGIAFVASYSPACRFIGAKGDTWDLNFLYNLQQDYVIQLPNQSFVNLNPCGVLVDTDCNSGLSDVSGCFTENTTGGLWSFLLGTVQGYGVTNNNDSTSVVLHYGPAINDDLTVAIEFICDKAAGIGQPKFSFSSYNENTLIDTLHFSWVSTYGCPLDPTPFSFPKAFSFFSAVPGTPKELSIFYDAVDKKSVAVQYVRNKRVTALLTADFCRKIDIDSNGFLISKRIVFDFQNKLIVQFFQSGNSTTSQCCFVPIPSWSSISPFFTGNPDATGGTCGGDYVEVWPGESPYLASGLLLALGVNNQQTLGCIWDEGQEFDTLLYSAEVPHASWFEYPDNVKSTCEQQTNYPCF